MDNNDNNHTGNNDDAQPDDLQTSNMHDESEQQQQHMSDGGEHHGTAASADDDESHLQHQQQQEQSREQHQHMQQQQQLIQHQLEQQHQQHQQHNHQHQHDQQQQQQEEQHVVGGPELLAAIQQDDYNAHQPAGRSQFNPEEFLAQQRHSRLRESQQEMQQQIQLHEQHEQQQHEQQQHQHHHQQPPPPPQQQVIVDLIPTHPFELPESLRHLVQSQTTYTYGNNVDQCFVFGDKEKAEQAWCTLQFDTFARRKTTPDTLHGGFHAQHSNLADILEQLRSHPDYIEDDLSREAQRKLARYPNRKWKSLCISMESRLSALNDEIQPSGMEEFGAHFSKSSNAGNSKSRHNRGNSRRNAIQHANQQPIDPKMIQHRTIKQRWMCSSAMQTSVVKEMERCRRRPKAIATIAHDVIVLCCILQRAVIVDATNNGSPKVVLPYVSRDQLFHDDQMNKRRWQVAGRIHESVLVYQTDQDGFVPEGAPLDNVLRDWANDITIAFKEIETFVVAVKTKDQHTPVPADAILNGLNAAEQLAAHAKEFCNIMGIPLEETKQDDVVLKSRPRDRGSLGNDDRKCPWNVEIWTYTNTPRVTLCIRDPRHTCNVLEHVSRQKLPQQTKDIIASLLNTGLSERQVLEELTARNEETGADNSGMGGVAVDSSASAPANMSASAAVSAVAANVAEVLMAGVVKRHDDRSSQLTITDVRNIRVRLGLPKPDPHANNHHHNIMKSNNNNNNNNNAALAQSGFDPSGMRAGGGGASVRMNDIGGGHTPRTTHGGHAASASADTGVIDSAIDYLYACHRHNDRAVAALRVVCKNFMPARTSIVRNLKQYHGVGEAVAMGMDEKAKQYWMENDVEPSLATGIVHKRARVDAGMVHNTNIVDDNNIVPHV